MNLTSTQIKDTYGNLLTIGTVAGTPTTGTLQNGAGSDLTSITLNGAAVFNEGGGNFDFRVEGDTDANLLFVDASTDRVGIGTSSPAVALDVVGQARASTGILFGTDTAADNTLDDYEEGTWDATLASGATTTPTVSVGTRYTKIGRVVHVTMTVQFTSITVNGTAVVITGLPFVAPAAFAVGNIGFSARLQYQASASHCWRIENGTELHAVYIPANTGTPSDLLSEASGTFSPIFTANITYTV